MGIINVSPDSFAGDGLGYDIDAIIAQAKRFVAEGVDLIDIGGESTRPGATPISVAEELHRVIPAIERLSSEIQVPLSIDTYKAEVARSALEAGAQMINDVWGLKYDLRLAEVAAEKGGAIILMSNQRDTGCQEVISEVQSSLKESIKLALMWGVAWENIIIDPGLGFGKTLEQNLEIIRRLDEFRPLGRPILIGPSRKSIVGLVLNLPVEQRLEGTAAITAISIAKGVDLVRVHDVCQMVRVCRMSDAILRRRQD